jgi:septal ring factor EnvC (AmiA/AmiB activator)
MRARRRTRRAFELWRDSLPLILLLLLCLPSFAMAKDRAEELEGLRDAIHDSRGRVTEHEADARAILEQLEEVDRRLQTVSHDRDSARRDVASARRRLKEIEPKVATAKKEHSRTQGALAARAVALYRGGEIGPVRVIFSATSLPDLLSRANMLRVLVRHDAELVARFGEERDRLEELQGQASQAVRDREDGGARLTRLIAELKIERKGKGEILGRLRQDRKSERRLLLELEQAAQALEETIRTLGARADRGDAGVAASGFSRRRGQLAPPVVAKVTEHFGRVVDPEFQTATFRSGVDFAASAGTSVHSVAPGIVRFSGWFRGYGRIVIVDHGDAFHSISGHLDEIYVEVGNPVEEGQALGTVGETGSLGGPSLYFELRKGGEPVDPEPWLLDARG